MKRTPKFAAPYLFAVPSFTCLVRNPGKVWRCAALCGSIPSPLDLHRIGLATTAHETSTSVGGYFILTA